MQESRGWRASKQVAVLCCSLMRRWEGGLASDHYSQALSFFNQCLSNTRLSELQPVGQIQPTVPYHPAHKASQGTGQVGVGPAAEFQHTKLCKGSILAVEGPAIAALIATAQEPTAGNTTTTHHTTTGGSRSSPWGVLWSGSSPGGERIWHLCWPNVKCLHSPGSKPECDCLSPWFELSHRIGEFWAPGPATSILSMCIK